MGTKQLQLKFYKYEIPDILSGKKTLEPRVRSYSWLKRLQKAEVVDFTYGPRFGIPTVFATAKILEIEIRPFETTTPEDLQKIALGWESRSVKEFIEEYTKWFEKQLIKGHPVGWIYFSVIDKKLNPLDIK